jgi:lipopolysaccharide biosynthesis regulator YciM
MNSDPIIQSHNLPNSSSNISVDGVSQLIGTANLAMAARFARNRQYSQAEQIILPLINMPKPRSDALNLLAKIYAQQGRFQNAAAIWRLAQSQEPDNRQFQLALIECERSTAESQRHKDWTNVSRTFVVLNIIFVISVVICITIAMSTK